jgi:hypothetical protein
MLSRMYSPFWLQNENAVDLWSGEVGQNPEVGRQDAVLRVVTGEMGVDDGGSAVGDRLAFGRDLEPGTRDQQRTAAQLAVRPGGRGGQQTQSEGTECYSARKWSPPAVGGS